MALQASGAKCQMQFKTAPRILDLHLWPLLSTQPHSCATVQEWQRAHMLICELCTWNASWTMYWLFLAAPQCLICKHAVCFYFKRLSNYWLPI